MADNEQDGGIEAPITINIGNICGGSIIDSFNGELSKVLDNVYDLGTSATATRGITLRLKLKPDESRTKIVATFECDSSLAAPHPVTSVFFVAKDEESGLLFGLAYDPRQQKIIFTAPKPKEAPKPLEFRASGEK